MPWRSPIDRLMSWSAPCVDAHAPLAGVCRRIVPRRPRSRGDRLPVGQQLRALQSLWRRVNYALGGAPAALSVFSDRRAARGIREKRFPDSRKIRPVRAADRVLPAVRVATYRAKCRKTIFAELAFRVCSAHRLRSSQSGARPRNRRDRIHGWSPGARAGGSRSQRARARARTRPAQGTSKPPDRGGDRRYPRPSAVDIRSPGVDIVYHVAAIYRQAGVSTGDVSRGQCDCRRRDYRGGFAKRRQAGRALQHGRRSRQHRTSACERGRPA